MAFHRWFLTGLVLALMCADARAGGDDLYGESGGHPPQFVGIARDIKSFKPIPQMRITAALKGSGQFFVTQSDAEGRFRIEGFSDDFNPENVQFTCDKPGYKTVNVIRRKISPDPKAPVEVECLNQPI